MYKWEYKCTNKWNESLIGFILFITVFFCIWMYSSKSKLLQCCNCVNHLKRHQHSGYSNGTVNVLGPCPLSIQACVCISFCIITYVLSQLEEEEDEEEANIRPNQWTRLYWFRHFSSFLCACSSVCVCVCVSLSTHTCTNLWFAIQLAISIFSYVHLNIFFQDQCSIYSHIRIYIICNHRTDIPHWYTFPSFRVHLVQYIVDCQIIEIALLLEQF